MSGDHEFNQVFFDARVPVTGRLGTENDGWSVANIHHHERAGKSATGMMMKVAQLRQFLTEHAEQGFDLLRMTTMSRR